MSKDKERDSSQGRRRDMKGKREDGRCQSRAFKEKGREFPLDSRPNCNFKKGKEVDRRKTEKHSFLRE